MFWCIHSWNIGNLTKFSVTFNTTNGIFLHINVLSSRHVFPLGLFSFSFRWKQKIQIICLYFPRSLFGTNQLAIVWYFVSLVDEKSINNWIIDQMCGVIEIKRSFYIDLFIAENIKKKNWLKQYGLPCSYYIIYKRNISHSNTPI